MIQMLKDWKGAVEIDGTKYIDGNQVINEFKPSNKQIHIKLYPQEKKANNNVITTSNREYRITVKQYMTKKASPTFDFMSKWNNDNPMPLRTMVGYIEKETRGMVYMHLHGDIYADRICTCMKCGKMLKNPVSQYFGIGPECGNHGYINPFNSEAELKLAVDAYKKELQKIQWSGWIIKSAIQEQEEVN